MCGGKGERGKEGGWEEGVGGRGRLRKGKEAGAKEEQQCMSKHSASIDSSRLQEGIYSRTDGGISGERVRLC